MTRSQKTQVLYSYDDKVSFMFESTECVGVVKIIDMFGTYFDNSEPYYDIYIPERHCIVKHIPQSDIKGRA